MARDNVIPFPQRGARPAGTGRPAEPAPAEELVRLLISEAGGPSEALAALQSLLGAAGSSPEDAWSWRGSQPVLLPRRAERCCFVVRVDLDDARPPIWRRLRLASDLGLEQLHEILQVAMGWTDSHLHQFQMGPERSHRVAPFLTAYDLEEGEDEGVLESSVRLDEVVSEVGDRLFYEYDFGDGWRHTLKLEHVLPWVEGEPLASCVAGRRACPPEDVGGMGGYSDVLAGLAGDGPPGDPEWFAEVRDWLPPGFDPAGFDLDEVNRELHRGPLPPLELWHGDLPATLLHGGEEWASLFRTAADGPFELSGDELAQSVHPYRVLLRTVGAGLKLTAAGYLPPRVVLALYDELGLESEWYGRGAREEQTPGVLQLRETATALGLVRKANGRLSTTRLGTKLQDDPAGLFAHIRSRLPLGRGEDERDAGLLGLLLTAAGKHWWQDREEAAALFEALGWYSQGGRLEISLGLAAHPTMDVLEQLAGHDTEPGRRALVARALLRRGS